MAERVYPAKKYGRPRAVKEESYSSDSGEEEEDEDEDEEEEETEESSSGERSKRSGKESSAESRT